MGDSSLIMLRDKPSHVDIPENQWKEMMQNILNGIFRKLNAVKNILTIDMYIAAGLYLCRRRVWEIDLVEKCK